MSYGAFFFTSMLVLKPGIEMICSNTISATVVGQRDGEYVAKLVYTGKLPVVNDNRTAIVPSDEDDIHMAIRISNELPDIFVHTQLLEQDTEFIANTTDASPWCTSKQKRLKEVDPKKDAKKIDSTKRLVWDETKALEQKKMNNSVITKEDDIAYGLLGDLFRDYNKEKLYHELELRLEQFGMCPDTDRLLSFDTAPVPNGVELRDVQPQQPQQNKRQRVKDTTTDDEPLPYELEWAVKKAA
jgi:hypothetical protein